MRIVKTREIITIIFSLLFIVSQYANAEEKVQYKYKTYEQVDLGNLEVKGEVIAPGDLSSKKRSIKNIKRNTYKRNDFRDHFALEMSIPRK